MKHMMISNHKNLIIILTIFLAFLIAFLILFFVLKQNDVVDISMEEIQFYENVNKEENKIYILGSSQVQAINSTHIESKIGKYLGNYKVYNLAKGSDLPNKRIDSFDLLIDSKPKLVLYGIGLRDIQKTPPGGFAGLVFEETNAKIEKVMPDPKKIIEEEILTEIGFYELGLSFLENPKFVLLNQIRNISEEESISTLSEKKIIFPKIPLMKYDKIMLKTITSKIPESKIPNCGYTLEFGEIFRNEEIVSLNKMIKKLHENKIDVIIFSAPHHKNCIDNLNEKSLKRFDEIIKIIGNNNDINYYYLHNSYRNYDSWYDETHLTFQNSFPYTNDISKIIITELT